MPIISIVMLIKKQKKDRLKTFAVITVVILFLIGIVIAWQHEQIINWLSNNNDTSKQTGSDSATSSGNNNDTTEQSGNDDADDGKGTNTDNEAETDKESPINTVKVVINDASQYDSIIEVRSYVEGVVETSGTCKLTFTKGGQTLTRTTNPLANPSYTTCETVDIPVSEFPSKGTWNLNIDYLSTSSKGSASATVEVQ